MEIGHKLGEDYINVTSALSAVQAQGGAVRVKTGYPTAPESTDPDYVILEDLELYVNNKTVNVWCREHIGGTEVKVVVMT